MTTKNILVTGGTGFIGGALCEYLLAQGFRVWVLTRSLGKAKKRFGLLPVNVIDSLDQLIDVPVFAIVNLAGKSLAESRWSDRVKTEIRRSRIDFTENILAWCQKNNNYPEVLINGSAIGIYGSKAAEVLTEKSAYGEDFAAQLCRDWESAAEKFSAQGGRVCLLRTGMVLAEDGGGLGKMLLPFKLGLGGPMGDGAQFVAWIHRGDLLRLIGFCLAEPQLHGPINAVAPSPVTNAQFSRLLASTLARPAWFPFPKLVAKLLFGEMAEAILFASQRVLPARAEAAGFCFEYSDVGEALKNILKK